VNIYRNAPETWNDDGAEYAVAVGVFDGVHRGHAAVFKALREAAGHVPVCALTFGVHPSDVISPDTTPLLLATLDRRLDLLDAVGLDAVAVIEFDNDVRHLTPDEFIETYLVDALRATTVSVGSGFRFGYGAEGTVDTLRLAGKASGFEVVETPIVELHGTEVRSSSIRAAIATGAVELAARMLGRPFEIEGLVVEGDQRGRTIGFPTANITMPIALVRPAGGVYAVRCSVDGVAMDGVSNVGTRPTFGGGPETIEVHILDETIDLYGKTVLVEFIDRIRNEQRFTSVDALVSQIEADVDVARAILA
jgi:riboflavin kinase/FMN adenylyltransferase